mgnify:CR=1 FL=1
MVNLNFVTRITVLDLLLTMKTHVELRAELLQNPEVSQEYDRLQPEFDLIRTQIDERQRVVADSDQSSITG